MEQHEGKQTDDIRPGHESPVPHKKSNARDDRFDPLDVKHAIIDRCSDDQHRDVTADS